MPAKRVLVVDDDRSILRLIETILRRELYDVETASGGREALLKIALTLYDVILLDLMMPDVSGVDVLAALHTRVPNVKCVVILSAASSFKIANSINPNVFASLRKPFDTTHLLSIIRRCLEETCAVASPTLPLQADAVAV